MASSMTVKIKRLEHGADLPLPVKATEGSSGYDLLAAIDADQTVVLEPGERVAIPTAVALALPANFEAQVRPRSGLALKHGITTLNTPGTIDADYRGEVKVILINHGQAAFTVERGMRIAQMVIQALPEVVVEEVSDLDETSRGTGGFGSTGHQSEPAS